MRLSTTSLLGALAVTASLGACGSKGGDPGTSKPGASESKPATPEKSADVASLFTGQVGFPTDLANVAFGATKDEIKKAFGSEVLFSSPSVKDVEMQFGYDEAGKLESVQVSGKAELEAVLTKAWGAPAKTKNELAWFAPASSMRVRMPLKDKTRVTYELYEPLETLLGASGFELAFAKGKPLFGATIDELRAGWGDALCNFDREAPELKAMLAELATEAGAYRNTSRHTVSLCQKGHRMLSSAVEVDHLTIGMDGRVNRLSLSIAVNGSPELKQQVVSFLDAKLGKATELTSKDGSPVRWYFDPASHIQVSAAVSDNYVSLHVTPYQTLAEVFGDKPGFAFETEHILGGTLAEIKADDPAHFVQQGTLASLVLPPLEFSLQPLEVDLQVWAKQTATHAFRFVTFHTDSEVQGDKVFELLKAKLGEPVKAEGSSEGDVTWNFTKDGRKVSARRVQQQWQIEVAKAE